MEIITSTGKDEGARKLSLKRDFGNDLATAVKLFGEKVVFDYYTSGIKIGFQNFCRVSMKLGKTDAEIIQAAKGWVPGVTRSLTPLEKAMSVLGRLSPEERKALLKQVKG